MSTQKKYWFLAKQYGWGWSFPTCWQGWAVIGAYAVAVVLLHYFFPPARDHVMFLVGMAMATAALLAVFWWKGEPPGWRWGR